jgi:hypothetical protein
MNMFWLMALVYGIIGTCGNATEVCGWNELNNAHIVQSAFVMFDTAFMGWTIVILFLVYQLMVFIKTRTLSATWAIGALFLSMYYGASKLSSTGFAFVKPITGQVLLVVLCIEFAGIIYQWLWK